MPTYSVRLIVNIPTVGERTIDQTGIVANTMEDAIQLAKANIVMTPTVVQRTAP